MATMIEGAVERANTVVENRKILSELIRKNEFVEPSQKELLKLFRRLNADNAKELVKDMKSFDSSWEGKKITDRLYGPLPGIPCGSWWGIRMDCSRDRMHDPFSASVQGGPVGAVSICTSHSNEDIDLGDVLTFTGQSWTDKDEKNEGRFTGDQDHNREREFLLLNFENRVPVRIVRSYNLSNEYSPKTGYRYDGLYMVVYHWIGVSMQNDNRCYKFALKRLLHQEPPPWKLKISRDSLEPITALKRYSKNCSLLSQGGTATRNNNTNDTIISRCISVKRFQNTDSKTPKVVRPAPKRRPRRNETSSEPEGAQESPLGPASSATLPLVSPGRKIVSTDHRSVHVSAIVTRRVSKKLTNNGTDNKLIPDYTVNKSSWNSVGVSESQLIGNEGEEDGVKSQSTRLQNTNISIRTDLYDSSHSLKQPAKKCGSGLNHGTGIFKPRSLGVPRRELNFAGVDSSPGSSRTVSSVKMERVESVDTKFRKRNLNHILCQEKEKAANGSSISNSDTLQREKPTSPVSRIFSTSVSHSFVKNNDKEDLETLKSRCLHRIEHSYASQCPASMNQEMKSLNCSSEVTNREEEFEDTKNRNFGNKTEENETEFLVSEPTASSESTTKETEESNKTAAESSRPISPSQSPLFRGFLAKNESSISMNLLTIEKMLDIISEEKSSPMAKMLISNVIGFPAAGYQPVFDGVAKTDSQIKNPEEQQLPLSTRTQLTGRQVTANFFSAGDLRSLGNSSSRKLKRFENSKEQKIIEIVYAGAEQDDVVPDSKSTERTTADSENLDQTEESNDKSNKIPIQVRKLPKEFENSVTRYKFDQESQGEEKEKDFCLRLSDSRDDKGEGKDAGISEPEDVVDFSRSEPMAEGLVPNCDSDKNAEQGGSRLTITGSKRHANSWKQDDPLLERGDLVKPDLPSQINSQTPKAQIITRSKCLQNSETSSQPIDQNSQLNIPLDKRTELNDSLEENDHEGKRISGEKVVHDPDSTVRVDRELSKNFRKQSTTSGNLANREGPKSKSQDKMRLVKRPGVRVKRKMEIANLFIDMNMSPRSQMSKAKLRSRRSLQGASHSRRRSCPAVVDRAMKRRSDDPVKHPTSPLKRIKKNVQMQNSSVQIASGVSTTKKGLSLRNKAKNRVSPLSNRTINNNNNNNSVKRIEKAEKFMNNIKKSIKSNTRNLVTKKNAVGGLRAPAEMRTRSGKSPRSLTVGRLGLRRALLSTTETYGRKNKMKMEKQKKTTETVKKQKSISAKKQQMAKKRPAEFTMNKTTRRFNVETEASGIRKPKMVSVMTQCSLIPVSLECPAPLVTSYNSRRSNDSKSNENSQCQRSSDNNSECLYSSRNSSIDLIKNEVIELIEIKSEAIDDDVATCDDEENETNEVGGHQNPNSAFDRASIHLKDHHTIRNLDRKNIQGSRVHSENRTSFLHRFSKGLGAFGDQESRASAPRKGFVPYVAGHRVSAFAPVRSVDGNLTLAKLKSIGFKPIKPGHFPPDGFEDGTEYGWRSTSDSPRIAYSSAVVKRGVHEEYDKYTSEENNVVQYMDSRLCYEDIENEDIISGGYAENDSGDIFVEKIEFDNSGTEMGDESNDNSFLGGGEREEEEEVQEEDEAEDFEEIDIKEWQSQLDENSSNSERNEQNAVDSDGEMPWHGWRKIISDKKTHFVGW